MLKNNINIIFFIIFISTFISGCRKDNVPDCFKGKGKEATEERQLPPFKNIKINDRFNLIISQDTAKTENAILKGGENLLPSVKMEVKDSTLYIEDGNTCNWVRNFDDRITIALNIKDLNKIWVHDDVYVKTNGQINLETFYIDHSGMGNIEMDLKCSKFLQTDQYSAGEITLKGYAAVFVTTINDVGGMYASGLQGDYTYVFHHGTNECHVKPKKQMGVSIFYTGNIFYYAEPSELVFGKMNGSGQLIKKF